jgi:hypothetical protein
MLSGSLNGSAVQTHVSLIVNNAIGKSHNFRFELSTERTSTRGSRKLLDVYLLFQSSVRRNVEAKKPESGIHR